MKKHPPSILFVFLLPAVLIGCEDSSKAFVCPALDRMSDGEKLFLADCIPIGSSYREVKSRVPSLSDLRDEVSFPPYSGILEDASARTEAYGLPARIEFNFRYKNLYSCYLEVSLPDTAAADSLYTSLRGTLSERLGQGIEETDREDTYAYTGSYWCQDAELGVLLGKRIDTGGASRVSWGYQDPCP